MKRCIALVVKLNGLGGKSQKRTKKSYFRHLALAILLCGVFYSLFFIIFQKTSLSIVYENYLVKYQDLQGFFTSAIAKEKRSGVSVKEIVCSEAPLSISVSNPALESYKTETLCCTTYTKLPEKPELKEKPGITELEKELEDALKGTPMETMVDTISKQDKTIAAFLVGIAFKESKFGVYSPKKNGRECYNYWGFKGKTNITTGGYSCFSSPEEAVEIVGQRLQKLVQKNNLNTPSKMTVWKCGRSCAGHSPESVRKWVSDVSIHFNSINKS
ncbi:MAG: hypothetical protein U9M90_03030 [Patescibacteria group bacterium]|nr:hypothetical protein [Patescibacteria group bacterium]